MHVPALLMASIAYSTWCRRPAKTIHDSIHGVSIRNAGKKKTDKLSGREAGERVRAWVREIQSEQQHGQEEKRGGEASEWNCIPSDSTPRVRSITFGREGGCGLVVSARHLHEFDSLCFEAKIEGERIPKATVPGASALGIWLLFARFSRFFFFFFAMKPASTAQYKRSSRK